MSKYNIADTMTKLLALLTPLESEDRQRVIDATLTLLGDSTTKRQPKAAENTRQEESGGSLPSRASVWMRQNALTSDILDQVFHIDGSHVEVIASHIPGKSNKDRTLNAYLLTGAGRLLATGDSAFDDKSARDLCNTLGCYDSTNHSKYMKDKGNRLAGSASAGWKLTGPGLTQCAALIKQMTTTAS